MKTKVRLLAALIAAGLLLAVYVTATLLQLGPAAAATAASAGSAVDPGIVQWAMMAAAVAAGLATLGAGIAVASVGSAAVGALAEKPELLGRLMIFVGLAEGIAIYGLIVAILILNRAG